jgi:hypothetical protein
MTGDTREGRRTGWRALLFPHPERRLPGERWLRMALRTLHIASMAVLVGGHVFDVPAPELRLALGWTVTSGVLLVLLEVHGTLDWLFQVRGLATVLKVALASSVGMLWEQRVPILMAVLAIGSLSSHAPSRIRHHSLLTGRPGERKAG